MVKIEMPVGLSEAVIHCEIDNDTFGHMDSCSRVLSTLVTAHYGYPVRVTVERDPELQWVDHDTE
jgi:hypothetical protein